MLNRTNSKELKKTENPKIESEICCIKRFSISNFSSNPIQKKLKTPKMNF